MKVVIRLPKEYPDLEGALAPDWVVRLVRGATIVETKLQERRYAGETSPQKCCYPGGLVAKPWGPEDVRIEASECGGGNTNTGHAEVICGKDGQPLRPYRVPKGYSNGTHAYFSAVNELVQVRATFHGENEVFITHFRIEFDSDHEFQLVEDILWHGDPADLPETFDRFSAAVEAAVEKCHHYHCREPHYIQEAK